MSFHTLVSLSQSDVNMRRSYVLQHSFFSRIHTHTHIAGEWKRDTKFNIYDWWVWTNNKERNEENGKDIIVSGNVYVCVHCPGKKKRWRTRQSENHAYDYKMKCNACYNFCHHIQFFHLLFFRSSSHFFLSFVRFLLIALLVGYSLRECCVYVCWLHFISVCTHKKSREKWKKKCRRTKAQHKHGENHFVRLLRYSKCHPSPMTAFGNHFKYWLWKKYVDKLRKNYRIWSDFWLKFCVSANLQNRQMFVVLLSTSHIINWNEWTQCDEI